jgi:hypothetical protein
VLQPKLHTPFSEPKHELIQSQNLQLRQKLETSKRKYKHLKQQHAQTKKDLINAQYDNAQLKEMLAFQK